MSRRRVYFAFHYQDVIDFRANVVRNSGVVADEDTFLDASLWEESKKKSPLALKRLINSGLDYTTTTSVLIGSETFSRPWVRYEIFKSFERGNGLLGVHINSIPDKGRRIYNHGPNPFDFTGFYIDKARKLTFVEAQNGKWIYYNEIESYRVPTANAESCERVWPFSKLFPVYDWVAQNGYNSFSGWVERSLELQAKYSFLAKG